MNYVEPIRDVRNIDNICAYLKETNERDYILFMMGIYSGLRVSDILNLKVKDLGKDYINIKEKKTGKQKRIFVNPILKKAVAHYISDKDPEQYLIKSQGSYNRPISRIRAYQILKGIGDKFGIDNLGTHSMRKTWGYHYYSQTKDIALLQKVFNHSSPQITLRYIGVDQDSIDGAYRGFRYR